MIPTVGRVVHFHLPNDSALPDDGPGEPLAAIITRVVPRETGSLGEQRCSVWLVVFHPDDGPLQYIGKPFSPTPREGHWTWPPRVS